MTVPLAAPSLATSAVLAWARALGEFGATILFAGNFQGSTQTMPLAIYGRYEAGDLGSALVLSTVLLATFSLILYAARLVGGSREKTAKPWECRLVDLQAYGTWKYSSKIGANRHWSAID